VKIEAKRSLMFVGAFKTSHLRHGKDSPAINTKVYQETKPDKNKLNNIMATHDMPKK
jgi:hypothetical protein